ncbi:phage protease [Chitinibacter sp. ZOR0017]|uniref:phage protease n=1 Tax=Chitinibacter sp. ZOR0017 TaxID=1339254 RepID=UPI00068A372F|nr:phage protease [Chitinibacter sp. ZOR0017]
MSNLAHLFAALSVELNPEKLKEPIKLLPAGEFRASDGRPAECAAWVLDAANAAVLVATAAAKKTKTVVDYEHQTLLAAENGKPAPASGWFTTLEWREGDGLYTVVDWTAAAAAAIEAKEYLYISPVFTYGKDGRIQRLLHVALTNTPALDDLPELSVAVLSRMAFLSTSTPTQPETDMDELLEQLRWLLNLPVGSTAEDVKAQLQKLMDQLKGGNTAAASVDLAALLVEQQTKIAALSANQADPAKFVPIETMRELQGQLAALTLQVQQGEVEELIQVALSDGRLLGAQEAWARDLGKTNLAALKGYLDTAPAIAALSRPQTKGNSPDSIPASSAGFVVPAGCEVNQASLSLHQAALEYQRLNGVPYETAVSIVEKQK